MKRVLTLVWILAAVVELSAHDALSVLAADNVDFNRDVRPILSAKCFACHGPDAKHVEGDLRLDLRDVALKADDEGHAAIVPGKPEASELVRRINSTNDDQRMPPATSNKQLTPAEREVLARWIAEGAEYKKHWAFVALERPAVPEIKGGEGKAEGGQNPNRLPPSTFRLSNPIDAFIATRLAKEGLSMAAEADKTTLLRRVTLDLTGLPPTPAEVAAFLGDASENAYERVVDRLLASPRYAERMTMNWLDLARYADTHGYNNDGERTQWPWRDWVINAFHTNMPYDQFIVDQLAGDMRENATPQQRLATGFGRNHVITSEGGIVEEEYRVEYVADRVHTTATVFLGLSMQCARCHDHKFDPITQRDYYSFFAFFNNVPEKILGYGNAIVSAAPFVQTPSPFQLADLEPLEKQITAIEERRKFRESQIDEPLAQWEREAAKLEPPAPMPAGLLARLSLDEASGTEIHDSVDHGRTGTILGNAKWTAGKVGGALEFDGQTHVDLGQLVEFEHDRPFSIAAWIYPTSNEPITVVSKIDDADAYRGFDLIIEQGKPAVHIISHFPDDALKVIAKSPLALNAWHHVLVTYDGSSHAVGVTLYVDGNATPLDTVHDKLHSSIKTSRPVHLGSRFSSVPFRGQIDDVQFYSTQLTGDDAKQLLDGQPLASLAEIIAIPAATRTPAQQEQLRRFYLDKFDEPYRSLTGELAEATRRKAELEKTFVPTMVMEEMPTPRPTFVLNRGAYDQPGDPVSPNVPASLPPLPGDLTANRLALAKWIVDPQNPLTARVTVNRWWQTYFGTGIVETAEDFGSQGAWPTHPELLDWLATELISSGWNVKAMQKLMVMSATYRQSSHVTPALLERDPKNQLLAHGPRFRLPAETVRDNALAISGLLAEKVGGPSVYPYQPSGLWEDVSVERKMTYKQGEGENLYRRSMYTFWKRTCPPPALSTFDAPDRETCLIRRARTNTPLQALVLMNDPTYVEAARKLAERVLVESGDTPAARLDHAFTLAVSRKARPAESQSLLPLLDEAVKRFRAAPQKAEDLLRIGQSTRSATVDQAELAAWTTIASVILNLDETISKEQPLPGGDDFMDPLLELGQRLTRRHFFGRAATGVGTAALASLLQSRGVAALEPGRARSLQTHFAPKAKRVIYLFQSGGPSQLEMFDDKPLVREKHGSELPDSIRMGQRLTGMTSGQKSFPVIGSKFKFAQHGQCGMSVSELLPHTARVVDDICLIRSMHTEAINHDPAITFIQTGSQQPGRPSLGAWLSYGLGSDNSDLPAFVVMISHGSGKDSNQGLLERLWGSGFLPTNHQGVKLRSGGDAVLYLSDPPGIDRDLRRQMLDRLSQLNHLQLEQTGDPEIGTRIAQFELAYRMQMSVPELTDFAQEPESSFELYGPDSRKPGSFAANCLLARRLAERGVRFIQLYHRGWDNHGGLPTNIPLQCRDIDQAQAALITDLKQRGMLEDTLIVWGGEFGRTVYGQGGLQNDYGRDHHGRSFSMWLAGGGIKPGLVYGSTDDYSYNVVDKPTHIHDLNATILHCLGIDHTKLTFPFQGRDFRLTDVHGNVVNEILA